MAIALQRDAQIPPHLRLRPITTSIAADVILTPNAAFSSEGSLIEVHWRVPEDVASVLTYRPGTAECVQQTRCHGGLADTCLIEGVAADIVVYVGRERGAEESSDVASD